MLEFSVLCRGQKWRTKVGKPVFSMDQQLSGTRTKLVICKPHKRARLNDVLDRRARVTEWKNCRWDHVSGNGIFPSTRTGRWVKSVRDTDSIEWSLALCP
jgi:hypothetical protein